jgi:VWFA-related protein
MRAALLSFVFASVGLAGPRQEPAQVFPSRVELVALELVVLDENGRPVRDLAPGEFRLDVAGRARHVATAEFISVTEESTEEPDEGSKAGFTTNETARPGRLVLIVVDTSSIAMGQGREVVAAAAGMLDRLAPTDRVGLLTIPSSGPREELTTDHGRVRAALAGVVGRGRFTGRMVSLVDAIACAGSDEGSLQTTLDAERCGEAIERECGSGRSCAERLREEAFEVASEYARTSSISRSLLKAAFETLRPIEGQKVLVLISRGLGFPAMGALPGSGGPELRELVSAAATSGVSFYVVPPAPEAAVSAGTSLPAHALEEDRRLHEWGLESLAVEAHGAFVRGAPERAFERVLRETTGYYRLGFEPEGNDRDGKARKVEVKVTRPGLVVRARPLASFAPPKAGRARKEALGDALRAPTLATTLPLRVATWTLGAAEAGMVRLLVGAEIGGNAEPQGLEVGYVLLDQKGKVTASASQPLLGEAREAADAIRYNASLAVPPGPYTLRLAVRDGRGRLGSVAHHVEAGLVRAGGLALSDLLLGRMPEAGTELPRGGRARGRGGRPAGARRDLGRRGGGARRGDGVVRRGFERDRRIRVVIRCEARRHRSSRSKARPGAAAARGSPPGTLPRAPGRRRGRRDEGRRRPAVPRAGSLGGVRPEPSRGPEARSSRAEAIWRSSPTRHSRVARLVRVPAQDEIPPLPHEPSAGLTCREPPPASPHSGRGVCGERSDGGVSRARRSARRRWD